MNIFLTETTIVWLKFIIIIGIIFGIYAIFKIWMEGKPYPLRYRADGKVVIITGANAGIGKETAMGLAERGAKVIMACRDEKRANIARAEIIAKSKNSNVHYLHLDLASFKSIRRFVKEFLNQENRLDILINNAGVMGTERTLTEDGLEMQMGVNHFGHFLLTMLLLDILKKSQPSRIVNVSSWGHTFFNFKYNDLNSEKSYNRFNAYAQSKLANVMFTRELAKKLKDCGVTVNALHPGVVYTELSRNLESLNHILFAKQVCDFLSKLCLRSTKSGAQTSLYVALDPNLKNISGKYFDDYSLGKINKDAINEKFTKFLWEQSGKITGYSYIENENIIFDF